MAKTKKFTVNMDDVEGRVLLPEGDYRVKIASGEVKEGNAAPYIAWKFTTIDDDKKFNGQTLYYNTSLAPQALWNLKNLMLTCDVEVPKGDTDPEDFVEALEAAEFMATVTHGEYEGKKKAEVTGFEPLGEEDSKPVVVDDGDEVEEDDEEEAPPPKKTKKGKPAPVEEDEKPEADEDEEEAEEEEEKLTEAEITEMDEDELLAVVKKFKLKVDLSKLPRAAKKVAAVLDALEAKGLLG